MNVLLSLYGEQDENFLSKIVPGKKFSQNLMKEYSLAKKTGHHGDLLKLPIDFLNWGEISPEYSGEKIPLIFEDKNFLVFDKPAKIHNHPLNYSDQRNVLSFCRSQKRFFKDLQVNKESYNRGLLNRLDFETSGVLIFVREEPLWNFLRTNFSEVAVEKIYLAKVKGKFPDKIKMEDWIYPFGPKKSLMKVSNIERTDAMKANASAERIDYNSSLDESILRIFLKSGVRHQIRLQLSSRGFAICGDELYGEKNSLYDRCHLHAEKYTLRWENREYSFLAPTPF